MVPFENIASVSLGSILLLALHLFPYYHSKSMSVQRKPVSIGNVNCHGDTLNLTTLASIDRGGDQLTYIGSHENQYFIMELEGADKDVGKIAMVVPILASEIQIHKQPLDAADILNFHVIKKNRDVNYLAIGYILYKRRWSDKSLSRVMADKLGHSPSKLSDMRNLSSLLVFEADL
ncbi:hypothetical protein Tco_0578479 [Tanacetum coccineum]